MIKRNEPKTKISRVGKFLMLIFMLAIISTTNSYAITLNLANVPLGEEKGFVAPVGVTTDGTDAYVADYGANTVFKITTSNFAVTPLISVQKPVGVAYYNTKLYVVTEGSGGKVYNASNGVFTGVTFALDIAKPSDIDVSPAGVIYVSDLSQNNIKTYDASTGAAITSFGAAIPINENTSTYGNGQFYIIAGLAYDSSTGKLLVADSGNMTPYVQVGSKYNYKFKTWTKSSMHYGRPKGKVQIYNLGTSSWQRQAVTHGMQSNYGQLINIYGIYVDANYIYLVDSLTKKIVVIDNVANDAKTVSWGAKQELNANEVAIADAPESDPTPSPARYATVHVDAANLGAYSNDLILFKDLVKIGSYLVVTDTTGRVFYFTIS